MKINEQVLSQVDLNLIVTFLVLCRERHVSRTAICMKVGQPAISGALVRLRRQFGDPLFVRTRTGMQPTAKALRLAKALEPALSDIQQILHEAEGITVQTEGGQGSATTTRSHGAAPHGKG